MQGKSAGKASHKGPSHVLFSTNSWKEDPRNPNESSKKPQGQFLLRIDPRLETDYISKRKRAFERVEWPSLSKKSKVESPNRDFCWDGVARVEQELVECCEPLEDEFFEEDEAEETSRNYFLHSQSNGGVQKRTQSPLIQGQLGLLDSTSLRLGVIGGVLDIDKEITFAAILARSCHTMGSRTLALAILERTMEAYLVEEAMKAQSKEQDSTPIQEEEQQGVANVPSNERTGGPMSQTPPTNTVDGKHIGDSSSTRSPRRRRFELFFAAGGLRILNQWLADAASYETKTIRSTTPAETNSTTASAKERNRKNQPSRGSKEVPCVTTVRIPSSTRPITLSILHFLKHIPFDKKMVMNSKINKQIQKLGKHIESIQERLLQYRQRKGASVDKEDLEGWTTQPSLTSEEALSRIQVAVQDVKACWREQAKTSSSPGKKSTRFAKSKIKEPSPTGDSLRDENPLEVIQSQIRERLDVLTKYETGACATKPEWYRPVAASGPKKKVAHVGKKRKHSAPSNSERERKRIQEKIVEAQTRSQKSLKELRERLQQRKTEHQKNPSVGLRSFHDDQNKKVTWKDGLRSQVNRNRKKLEDVLVYYVEKDLSQSIPENGDTK